MQRTHSNRIDSRITIEVIRACEASWVSPSDATRFKFAYRVTGLHDNTIRGFSNKPRTEVEKLAREQAVRMSAACGKDGGHVAVGLPPMRYGTHG